MTIRTISQLPEESNKTTIQNGFMEMSVPQSGTSLYTSKKLKYSTMRDDIKKRTTDAIVDAYGLQTDNKVSDIAERVTTLESRNMAFGGAKQFAQWPYVTANFPTPEDADNYSYYGNDYEYVLPNVKKVKEMMEENAIYMSTDDSYVAEGNPLPFHRFSTTSQSIPEALDYSNTIGHDKFYFWHIDNQQTDSSTSIHDVDSGSTDNYEKIRTTGNLVVWGWLAENSDSPPSPQCCWVALCAKMKCEGYDNTQVDVPIQIRPWIRGQNSSIMQYVSFNVPVKAGLELKIVTGFPVNASNSGLHTAGSLMFLDGNIPNAFYGYVIK